MKNRKYDLIDIFVTMRNFIITAIMVALIFSLCNWAAKQQQRSQEHKDSNNGYNLCISKGIDSCECKDIFLTDTCK